MNISKITLNIELLLIIYQASLLSKLEDGQRIFFIGTMLSKLTQLAELLYFQCFTTYIGSLNNLFHG